VPGDIHQRPHHPGPLPATGILVAINLYEDFIDVEGVTVALMLSFQMAGIFCAEFDASETDRFVRDGNASFSEQIFDISMTQIESVIDPYHVADDFGRESVSLVSIYRPILAITTSLFVSSVPWRDPEARDLGLPD